MDYENANFYWCIKVTNEISPAGEIYLHAQTVELDKGDLIFKDKKGQIIFAIGCGAWLVFFAASVIDGAPVYVEHWKDEKISKKYKE